jgi:hypothetical protein
MAAERAKRHDIPFPFEPYPVQRELMEAVYDTMDAGTRICFRFGREWRTEFYRDCHSPNRLARHSLDRQKSNEFPYLLHNDPPLKPIISFQ